MKNAQKESTLSMMPDDFKGTVSRKIEYGILFWLREGQISICNFWLASKKYLGAYLRKLNECLISTNFRPKSKS